MLGKLTDLQARVLATLAPVEPRWTLSGGAALAGFHLQHRTTRDLDLFWHGVAAFAHDTPHEILVNKLGALLHRAEVRDLIDLRALLAAGGDLTRALRDASVKDGGFSPLMLGYLLQGFPLTAQAAIAGLDATATAELDRFRAELATHVAEVAQP